MSSSELTLLILIVAAFRALAATLAWVSWRLGAIRESVGGAVVKTSFCLTAAEGPIQSKFSPKLRWLI
jgi:hypothetical protein